jgi:cytochrome P450
LNDLYYDPWDFNIDLDPYPVYRRLRDESPVYYNERHGFWGVSRYADVDAALKDTARLSSARGDILEVVMADPVMPPGIFINEDPPLHTIHRAIVSRAFTPKKMRAVEDKIRAFCIACLDLVGGDRFDFVLDLGAELPMRTIGMLAGIPNSEQPAVRAHANQVLRNEPGKPMDIKKDHYFTGEMFGDYVDWRERNPSDDLITELLNVEFEDETGTTRKLAKQELTVFLAVVAGAGVETTGRLFGWMGKVLGEHPDQRKELASDHSRIPAAIEELLRFEPPGPHVARYVATDDVDFQGQTVPAGSALLIMLASANRDERHFDDPDSFDIHRKPGGHLTFGRGAHFCVGAPLARLEGRIALEEVLKRWPEWDIDMTSARRSRTSTVRGWDSMPAVVAPR